MSYLPIILPLLLAALACIAAVLKHLQHAVLAEVLEEAILLEHEYEDGKPLADLLREAAGSQAAHDALDAVMARVKARQSPAA